MPPLSPKKYIETKARTLPIYKCFVNKDWAEAKLAKVLVMRRHVNGNVTAGLYLADLLCLGVKDCIYFFNQDEDAIQERLRIEDDAFIEIEYKLAHNIIYAAHDFALDFDIKSCKEFAVAKFILEEDDDRIPLIEIETGRHGKPHLFETTPGQYADILLKLKKHVGEGNYYYTTGYASLNDDGIGVDDPEEILYHENLHEYPEDTITPNAVKYICTDDLKDGERVRERSMVEQTSINTELYFRLLDSQDLITWSGEEVDEWPEYQLIEQANEHVILAQNYLHDGQAEEEFADYFKKGTDLPIPRLERMLKKYSGNPWVISSFYERFTIIGDSEQISLITISMEQLAGKELLPRLLLALSGLLNDEKDDRFPDLYESQHYTNIFPRRSQPNLYQVSVFFLLQVLLHARKNDISKAFYFYELFVACVRHNWMTHLVQVELCEAANRVMLRSKQAPVTVS